VTGKRPQNLAASVRQRLLNLSRRTGRPYSELSRHFAMERFLYRLSKTPQCHELILKGALMFVAWGAPRSRPTMDIDLLDQGSGRDAADVLDLMKRACEQDQTPDGLIFDPATAEGSAIGAEAATVGVRIGLRGMLGTERVVIQVDVAFGDEVVPAPSLITYPTLLDFPAPELLGYSRESVVAEKFNAVVTRGALNTRLKDFYDIWLLSRDFEFEGGPLSDAIRRTFAKRGTTIPPLPAGLTRAFAEEAQKQAQWTAFIRKSLLGDAPRALAEVVADVAEFLLPLVEAMVAGRPFPEGWPRGGPWCASGR
jgi:predicted nucleotidyltransferase component of viral defense system